LLLKYSTLIFGATRKERATRRVLEMIHFRIPQ
jgi:hypothetical protein